MVGFPQDVVGQERQNEGCNVALHDAFRASCFKIAVSHGFLHSSLRQFPNGNAIRPAGFLQQTGIVVCKLICRFDKLCFCGVEKAAYK